MPEPRLPARPIPRQGFWYLVRAVPKDLRTRHPRASVMLSTGIRVAADPRAVLARPRIQSLDEVVQQTWQRMRDGISFEIAEADLRAFKRGLEIDLPSVPAKTTAAMSLRELWERFEKVLQGVPFNPNVKPRDELLADVSLVFGSGLPTPNDTLMVSQMLAEYERINATKLANKSKQQLRIWRVRRQSALDTFIASLGGDLPLSDLTVKHVHKFRAHWQQRALAGEVQINSANRSIRQVAGLYRSISSFHQFEQRNPFEGTHIPGGRDGKRLAYDPAYVQERFLAEGVFADLNLEVRCAIYLIIETGLRLSEVCALTQEHIHLDGPIPYVEVRDDHQETKTAGSVRSVPLVGVALLAMRMLPKGFVRYYHKANQLSAVINNALAVRGLRPQGQSIYSMRHTLIDRLKAVEAPNDVQEDLVGHVHLYGQGTTLEHRHRWLQQIVFRSPSQM